MSAGLLGALGAKERRQVEDRANAWGCAAEDAAVALLRGHLILMRECADALPVGHQGAARDRAIRLGGGRNA